MSKKGLSGTDVCERFITPVLHQAGWLKEHIPREHSFTADCIIIPVLLIRPEIGGSGKMAKIHARGQVQLPRMEDDSEMQSTKYCHNHLKMVQ